MILIIAGQGDAHALKIVEILQGRGRSVICLSTADFGPACRLSFDPAAGHGEITLADGTRISTRNVASVWYRRPRRVRIDESIRDLLDLSFAENEWLHAVDGFFSTAFTRVISDPLSQRAAIKPRQLQDARRAGLRVPETLVTNDAADALAFVERHEGAVVHKGMTSPAHRFVDTRAWSRRDLDHIADLGLCPTVFQERVPGVSDVRVTVVGRRTFAARIDTAKGTAAVDSRLDLDAPCEPHALPEDVEQAIHRLMDGLNLRFGTVDLKLTDEGEHVFLEVNPQGQFLYVEILTGLPIAEAVADLLEHE
jgi:hypothetical protein